MKSARASQEGSGAGLTAAPRTTLRVQGMDCADEVSAIQSALRALPDVRDVRVNLMGGTVTVAHARGLTANQLITAIAGVGLKAFQQEVGGSSASAPVLPRGPLLAVALSVGLTGVGLAAQWFRLLPVAGCIAAFALAIVAGGWLIFPKALRAIRRFAPDMNLLMTMAVIGAAGIGEWSEGAAVASLFALAELLEMFSVARARRAIRSLMSLAPETAWRKEGDGVREVPVERVVVGDIVAVRSGSRVPVDGVVGVGTSSVNQAPITGESVPVEKRPGDAVFAGTINGEGALEVRVTKLSSDTTLARIIHLVEEAQSQKAPSQRFVDSFAKYYTPGVMALALLAFLVPPLLLGGAWAEWFYRALVLLVISCPCALVISTPVSVVSGLTAMARRGVLIKGGAFLEAIGKLGALALDKTGTITEGRPRVTRVVSLASMPPMDILRIAAAVDTHSEHPLAQAVVAYSLERDIAFPRAQDYRARTGRGAEGEVDGHRYFVGNHRFARELGACSDALEQTLAEIESSAQSVVVVGHAPHADCAGEALGVLAVGDTVRPEAARAIRSLHAAGVRKIVMLSGDNQRTVTAVAGQVAIDEAHGDLLPEQKVERIRALIAEHGHVGMVGDGVNDAPAMAAASVGIAMGAAGTDTAIETADIALMQDDLVKVAEAIRLGRRTVRVIHANIVFSLAVKGVFLGLAVLGHTSLWLAILADTGATLVVVANALRLLKGVR
jgi:Cd2+/Zn2+-exporting ATPase